MRFTGFHGILGPSSAPLPQFSSLGILTEPTKHRVMEPSESSVQLSRSLPQIIYSASSDPSEAPIGILFLIIFLAIS